MLFSLKCTPDTIKWIVGFIGSTSLNSKPNSIQIDRDFCEIIGVEEFLFSQMVALNLGPLKPESKT